MNELEVGAELLAWLRVRLECPELKYAELPRPFAAGVDATLYAFSLVDAPRGHDGPLVLRLFPPATNPDRAGREAAIQQAVVSLGYPAPAARSWGELGGARRQGFVVMDHVPGRTFQEVTMGSCVVALTASVLGIYVGWALVAGLYIGIMVRWLRRLHGISSEQAALEVERAGLPAEALRMEARLDDLAVRIEAVGAHGLWPGVQWLRDNLPASDGEVLCHGDFWPGNMLWSRGGIAVIDWGDAALAPREYELAWSQVAYYSGLPVGGPEWLADLVARLSRPVVWFVLSLYRVAYGAIEPLSALRMEYFTAYHCLRSLTYAAERRASIAAGTAGPARNHWASAEVVELVERRFQQVTETPVHLSAPDLSAPE